MFAQPTIFKCIGLYHNSLSYHTYPLLGGDFLLSRASISLARLRNLEVVELLSTVIEHLVKGEVMQMRPSSTGKAALEYYLRKNFYKTASLMGPSCLAAAVLGGHTEQDQRACYLYGTYVGQAFQLIDDTLDFEGSTATIGKAPLADLKSGLATAPTLFAAGTFSYNTITLDINGTLFVTLNRSCQP